jgi:cytochrome c oxidase assembly protein subunit 15
MENTTLHEKTDTLRSHSDAQQKRYPKVVKAWLIAGLVLIFVQVVVGGITRLTGSGLSITKWEIVTGTLPPANADQWEEAFDLYKATPQYQKINEGMSMPEFKFIYFWEYFHRLWARMMGFVFYHPFHYFLDQRLF